MADCLFCKIVEGKIPAKKAYEDDEVLAFDDIQPQAPVHVLVIPKKHVASLNELSEADDAVAGKLLRVAARIAKERGIAGQGWRATVNVGKDAHQLVFHVHLHLMGGRAFTWPPG
jgi:histidine triad (HIT) family protein